MSGSIPWASLVGGVVIGVSVAALWILNGKTAGISGIVAGALTAPSRDGKWQYFFLSGLVGAGVILGRLWPARFDWSGPRSVGVLIGAGLLVGFGTRLSGGCTSGHGLCGLSRFSKRSGVATGIFMALGSAAAIGARHLLGAFS